MSVSIYPVRPEQLVRLGARTALQPLAPYPAPRYHRAPWDTTRRPFDHRNEPHFPPRLADIHLGQDATAAPAPPAPERVTYTLTVDAVILGNAVAAVSTPALPAPCTIETATLHHLYTTIQGSLEWQLLLSPHPLNGPIDKTAGEQLIIPRISPNPINFFPGREPYGVLIPGNTDGSRNPPYTLGPIGRLVTEPGTYLAFAIFASVADTTGAWCCAVTVQRHQAR